MRKRLGVVALLALALAVLPAKAQDRVDLIVLLDSSQSMFQFYNQVVDYVLSGTVTEYMRFGDAFHLVSFSDSTQIEISQVLRTEGDLKSVIARLYLLYPLGRNTDLVTALKNVYQYVADLPESSLKNIVLITDGMHSPAPDTSYSSLDPDGVRVEIEKVVSRMRERGWTMRIVRVPFDGSSGTSSAGTSSATEPGEASPTSPGTGDYLTEVAEAAGTDINVFDPANGSATLEQTVDLPRILIPSDLGERDYAFSFPVEIVNGSSRTISVELTNLLLADGTDILTQKVLSRIDSGKSATISLRVSLPDTLPEGYNQLTLEPRFAEGLRVSPARSLVSIELKKTFLAAIWRKSVIVLLFFAILAISCIAVLVVVLYIRHAHRKASEPIVEALIDSGSQQQDNNQKNAVIPIRPSSSRATPKHEQSSPSFENRVENSLGKAVKNPQAILATAGTGGHQALDLNTVRKSTHRDGTAALELLASASKAASTGYESKAVSTLDSWKPSPSSRHALPLLEKNPRAIAPARLAPVQFQSRVARQVASRIILHVVDQNANIGKRNIHVLQAGTKKSVGGGSSDFLIFLLPVPKNLAYLHFDGLNCVLVPERPELFPDYTGPIEACLGKEIRMITPRNKELVLRFDKYVSPVETINTLLHCIEVPGIRPIRESAVDSLTDSTD